ncbi:MAG: NAD(P)-dependent oxidoreductase [Acidimicrobiales bacterium]|nr:MAG: NAD(P)-dependent oxidoreductase [Acidimicrobiales bacterium]
MARRLRVVVTGAAGQLGSELVREFADYDLLALDRAAVDVTDRDQVFGAILSSQPDVVVHPAAWTDVDGCELDPDRAYKVNALGTRLVSQAAALAGAHIVYVSTDYVFDGTKADPYHEWDQPNPLSVYGRSKLAGEREALEMAGPRACVVRTSWVCGRVGRNMVKTVLRLASEAGPLRFVDDQRGCPTFAEDLAHKIRQLAVARVAGVVHVTNQGAVSWYEFARAVLEAAGQDPDRVEPIKTADLDPPRPAPRPANSVLRNFVLEQMGFGLLPEFGESLERLVVQLLAE